MSENGKVNSQVAQDPFRTLILLLTGRTTWQECPAESQGDVIHLARQHFLAGALFIRTRDERLEPAWAQQRLEAALAMENLESLERTMREKGLPFVRLKGASLIPRYYLDLGFRHLCDVDVLVQPKDLTAIEDVLATKGYKYQPVVQWKAASYRRAWMRRHNTGMPMSVDIHTRIMWDQESALKTRSTKEPDGYTRLTDEIELLHLIVNWVEQDTCISFNKMYDIYFAISQSSTINWQQWMENPAVARHWRAILIVKAILNEYFAFAWPVAIGRRAPVLQSILRRNLRRNFFSDPRRNIASYFLFKHLTKSLWSAVVYDILWGVAHAAHSARLLVVGDVRRLNYGE